MKACASPHRRRTDVRLPPNRTRLRCNETPSSNPGPTVDGLRRHEPELDSVPGELAAAYVCDLGEATGSDIHRSTDPRACACEFAATGSRGVDRFLSNRGRARCTADDSRRGEAWLRHGAGRQLSALGSVLTPIMIPLLVGLAGWLYGRNIWVSPAKVLAVIAKQQFVPLLIGMALMYFVPAFSTKIRSPLNVIGNAFLMVTFIVLLVKMGPALTEVSPWVVIAVLLLAVSCIAASLAILTPATVMTKTLVVCNVNRHVGLALLLSGTYFRNQKALPAIAAYALAAQLMIWLYAKLARYRPIAT